MSIHDLERNIKQEDGNTYIDSNFANNAQFQVITQTVEPWASFWHSKQLNNQRLLTAVSKGDLLEVKRLLNPLQPLDEQPEVRYTDDSGMGAVHLAVVRDQIEILKVLLETDKTLLCMPTEDEREMQIIHLAVESNNLTVLRYLLGNPNYFRLFNEA